jgi:hypothetical protein
MITHLFVRETPLNYPLLIKDTKIGHIGFEESLDAIKDTIYEFNLLKKCKIN